MKIIGRDNFDRDTVDDVLVAENVLEKYAEDMAQLLNEKFGPGYSDYWFVVEKDDYKLKVWEP